MNRPPMLRTTELTLYLTPFAAVLILCATAAGRPRLPLFMLLVAGALAGVVFNWYTAALVERDPVKNRGLATLRPRVNYLLNLALAFILYPYLREIWLLFTLAPLGVAVHRTQVNTLWSSVFGCAGLLLVHVLRGPATAHSYLVVTIDCLFIVMLPLFVHALAHPADGPVED